MFKGIYKSKKVLITGNTGFKGAWLTIWLNSLGAKVFGLSKDIPSKPSLFEITDLKNFINHTYCDIRNLDKTSSLINKIKPDFIFHMAAQPIVKESYNNPVDTMSSNIMGTTNILEALRISDFQCNVIMITSDKCYDNVEWEWGYKETDPLGGKDPYSASKGAAELIIKTYYESFFKSDNPRVKICSVRAGNVIGGADWAADRLVPDMFRSWSIGKTVSIRSPHATRPWQHVLEPLSGYLVCGLHLAKDCTLNGLSFNFGPDSDQNKTVLELLNEINLYWNAENQKKLYQIEKNDEFHEAGLLKLNCDRALHVLEWKPTMRFKDTVKFTALWYNSYYNEKHIDMLDFTFKQILDYQNLAKQKNNKWAI